jgi:hypothetical protein
VRANGASDLLADQHRVRGADDGPLSNPTSRLTNTNLHSFSQCQISLASRVLDKGQEGVDGRRIRGISTLSFQYRPAFYALGGGKVVALAGNAHANPSYYR